MKLNLYMLIPAMLAFSSCGTTAVVSSGQRFNDGIYRTHSEETPSATATDDRKVNELAERTRNSEIYLFSENEQPDTVIIPENKSAVINFNNSSISSITITDDPFEQTWYASYAIVPAAAWAVSFARTGPLPQERWRSRCLFCG